MCVDKSSWIGIAIAIIAPASEGIRRYLEDNNVIQSSNPAWLIANITGFLTGIGILVWTLCFKKDKKRLANSVKPPLQLIPKRKVKRVIYRTEVVNGKTKHIKEIELDP
jgi:hypothetical protein